VAGSRDIADLRFSDFAGAAFFRARSRISLAAQQISPNQPFDGVRFGNIQTDIFGACAFKFPVADLPALC